MAWLLLKHRIKMRITNDSANKLDSGTNFQAYSLQSKDVMQKQLVGTFQKYLNLAHACKIR